MCLNKAINICRSNEIASQQLKLMKFDGKCNSFRKLNHFAAVCRFEQKDSVHNVGHKTGEAMDTTESNSDESIFKIEEISTVKTGE